MWHNRNACVLLTLERQSVNVLTCEFAHRIRGSRAGVRVRWGEKEGGGEESDRPGRPAQREQRGKLENNPPTQGATHGAPSRGTTLTNMRPNLKTIENRNHDPPAKNNPTRAQPERQATRQTGPPPSEKNCNPQDAHQQTACTAQRRDSPNQEPQPTKRPGRELRRGLRGTAPRVTPPRQPDTGTHPQNTATHQTPQPQKPTPTRNHTPKPGPHPPSYHPTTHTPPGTLHTCHGPHPAAANACQQTGTNSENKSSQKRTTNAQASTQ